ncbi:tetratricopeptide repeat protein [Lentisphaera profundi]|uniref:Tetratricopeptide repeat protein n=1 Tax=Lentisphaera profundi TaxID=1658616 RepID=A0ABY7VR35_9BACT|nr:tetratricopeptide repeat protein [Lentisphaera profundi]WDE96660.1 tetratricopeptide repeat protein [Lentisphaera profundi]
MKHLLLLISLFSFSSQACVNSSYSRLDEKKITNEMIFLALGQFAHRSESFYLFHEQASLEKLRNEPEDFEARNDLAVAYIKLAKYTEAEAELDHNEKLHPGRYETAANYGVLFKKKGEYAKAAKFIAQSLGIKPEGHMGLGDYYLKMCEFLVNEEMEQNFLGVNYIEPPVKSAAIANKEYIVSLIKNDYAFADAYYILGDILYTEGNLQLAIHAYAKAGSLNPVLPIRERYALIRNEWREQRSFMQVVEDRFSLRRKLDRRVNGAERWGENFKLTEEQLMRSSQRIYEFGEIFNEMEIQGMSRVALLEVGTYLGFQFPVFLVLFVIIAALLIGLKIASDQRKKRKNLDQEEA